MRGYMIEMEQEKKEELKEYAEDILRCGGKLMQCLEEMCDEPDQRMGYRRGVKGTGKYGMRSGMGYRNDDMDMPDRPMPGMMGYRDPYYK